MVEKHFGKLSKGCKLCFEGKKSVLFVTGICPKNCLYCPLSEEKKNKDITHINELKTSSIKNILKEIEQSDSKGIGITGGDPISKISRTIKIIKATKKKFGKDLHIHLYTSPKLLTKTIILKLQKTGLDEIRLHPEIENEKNWNKISLITKKFKETGIEIPALPKKEKQIQKLIDYAKNKVDFFNLNQLEYATLHEDYYKKQKWKINKDYSVKESKKTALKILNKNKKLRIHYCSSKFKDKIQFTERVKRRAKKVATKHDIITSEGTLILGAIYTKSKKQLKKISLEFKKQKIPFAMDIKKQRVVFHPNFSKNISKRFKCVCIIEEYPTVDRMEIEKQFLS